MNPIYPELHNQTVYMKPGTKKNNKMISEVVDIFAENQIQGNEVKINTLRKTDDSFSHTE